MSRREGRRGRVVEARGISELWGKCSALLPFECQTAGDGRGPRRRVVGQSRAAGGGGEVASSPLARSS